MSWPASRNVPPQHLAFRAAARVAAERLLLTGGGWRVALFAAQTDPWNPTRGTFKALDRTSAVRALRDMGHPTACAAADAIDEAEKEHPTRIPIICALATGEVLIHWIEPRKEAS